MRGQRVFTCGHSFHVWVPEILAPMAAAAGFADHQTVGVSSIGGSRVIQHWDVPDPENKAKRALRAGGVDVLTLSPIWLPEEGIEKFAALAVRHNPRVRITVQEYWLPNDTYEPVYPLQCGKAVDHDATVLATLRREQTRYLRNLEDLVRGVNGRLGQESVVVVPVGQATLALRERIAAGRAPGLTRQAELFSDSWGHPTAPLQVLSTYCHFAVIYGRDPAGLPRPAALAANTAWDDGLNRLLQELAWSAVSNR